MNDIVYSVAVDINKNGLQHAIDFLNKEIDIKSGEQPLTVEEVVSNSDLLQYICNPIAAIPLCNISDMHQFWANNGWNDWINFR